VARADTDTLYRESGSSYWPVLWGPAFALAGLGVEWLSGSVHVLAWALAGIGLAGMAAVWVQARRGLCRVELTADFLMQGRERLPVARIREVDDVGLPIGARVLGGGWLPPKGAVGVPVRLDDGSVVLAWAKDDDALRAALRALLT